MGDQELVDCDQVRELLDGYALGAASRQEADLVERHIGDCLGCWEELTKSQQTAALLALSVPIRQAPAHLEQKILAQIERDRVGVREEPKPRLWDRLRIGWPATAGALGAASLAVLMFSAFLQMQVSDLEGENNDLRAELRSTTLSLERQLSLTDSELEKQQTIFQVVADSDAREISAHDRDSESSFDYIWSPDTKLGYVRCSGLPILAPGKVYQLWVTTPGDDYPVTSFRTFDGTCQIVMDMSLFGDAAGLGISIENSPGGIGKPADKWELHVRFSDD